MPKITIGSLAAEPVAEASWDSVWVGDNSTVVGGWADWLTAGQDAGTSTGGFRSTSPVETAILIQLFTDRRLPDEFADTEDDGRGGWHGDTFDIDRQSGEGPIGSLLWTLDRASLNNETARRAEHYAAEALQTLIDQRVVGRFDIEAETDSLAGTLVLHVQAFAPDTKQLLYVGALPII